MECLLLFLVTGNSLKVRSVSTSWSFSEVPPLRQPRSSLFLFFLFQPFCWKYVELSWEGKGPWLMFMVTGNSLRVMSVSVSWFGILVPPWRLPRFSLLIFFRLSNPLESLLSRRGREWGVYIRFWWPQKDV